MTEFTITRSTWDRGRGTGEMFNSQTGCACAFGQLVMKDLQIAGPDMEEQQLCGPEDVCQQLLGEIPALLAPFVDRSDPPTTNYYCKPLGSKILKMNDDIEIEDDTREACLVALFAEAGITLKFED